MYVLYIQLINSFLDLISFVCVCSFALNLFLYNEAVNHEKAD